MNKQLKSQCIALSQLLLVLLVITPCMAEEKTEIHSVRRIDPRNGELTRVDQEQVKPGKIYNYFSERHGRYVWAYAIEGGGFSYALGIGSTELPENFDVPISQSETDALIAEALGPWFKRSRSTGSKVFVRLGANDKWQVVQTRAIRSHFDIDNSLRWEWHGQRRVAVMHTNGYTWQYDGNRYVPAYSPLIMATPIINACHCSDCW